MREAVVVIDVMAGIFELGAPVHDAERFLASLEKLLHKARAAEIPIIHVQHSGPEGSPFEKGGQGWQIHPRVAPGAADRTVEKRTPDSFLDTGLDSLLKELGSRRLYIAGFASEGCVDTAVRCAHGRRYEPVLISDCHSTTDSETLEAAQIIAHHNHILSSFARVARLEDIRFNEAAP